MKISIKLIIALFHGRPLHFGIKNDQGNTSFWHFVLFGTTNEAIIDTIKHVQMNNQISKWHCLQTKWHQVLDLGYTMFSELPGNVEVNGTSRPCLISLLLTLDINMDPGSMEKHHGIFDFLIKSVKYTTYLSFLYLLFGEVGHA